MNPLSDISYIEIQTEDPVQMFSQILEAFENSKPNKTMPSPINIATFDDEFGALNRTVNYRGLTVDKHITIVTQKDSRKYANIMKDPRVTVTFYLEIPNTKGQIAQWQIRLFGKAIELSPGEISNLWNEETVFAKIRSRICDCGKPIEYLKLKETHDTILKAYENGEDSLPQTELFTAFKVVPSIWDFYKSDPNCIGDRIQYRKDESDSTKWIKMHVAA
ncbi:pyridoxine/pyridoxamine 5'-phosphate oxidase-like [Episyrphus balteatus]|uniref:pyridoxine/pyridoxamine 5'-phosphate oxidase-like n=1 Tax=Episyrphus balteatus TaxID=286459 RepID=UPI0024861711|nr:pyridoxine/pyridoxamine 5'-phosphate oxidase-like [Episyrphus balteatus]